MDNEKFQGLVLEQLKSLTEGQNSIENRLGTVDKRFDAVDVRLDTVDKRLDSVDKRLDAIDKKLNSVYEQTAMLTEFRTETNSKLNDISNTVEFLMHKGSQTEKEIFTIKRDMSVVKK